MCHGQVTWDDIVGPWSSIPWRGNPGIMGYWNPDEHVLTISKYLQCQAKFDMAHRPATKTWHLAGWFISSTLQQTTEVRKLYEWHIPQGLASIYIYIKIWTILTQHITTWNDWGLQVLDRRKARIRAFRKAKVTWENHGAHSNKSWWIL